MCADTFKQKVCQIMIELFVFKPSAALISPLIELEAVTGVRKGRELLFSS